MQGMTVGTSGNAGTEYSVREVSEMLGLSPRQIRALVADGLLHPSRGLHGRFLFSFQDLILLRGVAHLVDEGVPGATVRSAVARLRSQLPDDTALTEARLDAAGGRIVVHLDAASWEPESGQTVMDLDVDAVSARVAAIVDARVTEPPIDETAMAWYAHADAVEQTDPVAAEVAYRRAIELDPGFADAHLNLGRLLHAAGAIREALDHYRIAGELEPDDATTLFNIGVAQQDLGNDDAAIESYQRAIALAPRFADARFNLAAVHERRGEVTLALQQLRAYRDLIAP
jgi:tetratricopeptide (TPR) repeat protein